MPKVRMIALILLFAMPACSPFAGGRPIVTPSAAACSALLPPEWREGVAGAELPQGDLVGDWIAFADAQTGRLDQANGRTRDAIGIVERCEARDRAAVERATRPGLIRRIFGG